MTITETLKLALEALENSMDLVREDAYQAEQLYSNYPTRQGKVNGLKVLADDHEKAITALREALAEQPAQQEPVAAECKFDREQKWVRCEIAHHNLVQSEPHKWPEYQTRLLYTSPPAQRTWVGLTDEEIDQGLLRSDYAFKTAEAWRAGVVFAMTKLKEKNT